ncbi:MAG: hypothetical protein DDT31_01626 [Syntrophomonadaceae bacterium]|nr:hypothetical protein [Bacillota bacterium]
MRDPSIVGSLKYLYLDEIEIAQAVDVPSYLVRATAKLLQENGGHNWVPVIVKVTGDSAYEVIGNTLAYAVAEQAGLERVWCVVADDAENTALLARALSGEVAPPLNLSTASKDDIRLALEYLTEQPGSPLKGIKAVIAASKIFDAPRDTWKNLNPIASLKCGITKGKKLDYLKKLFYVVPSAVEPEPVPVKTIEPPIGLIETPNVLTEAYLTEQTIPDLKEIAKTKGVKILRKLKKAEIIQLLLAQA